VKRNQPLTLKERRRQIGELLRGLSPSEVDALVGHVTDTLAIEQRRSEHLAALEEARQTAKGARDSGQLAHVEAEIETWSALSTTEARVALGIPAA
jgi:hypothetical protein